MLLFLFVLPPPPRSTLFPYTTLFRSTQDDPAVLRRILRGAGMAARRAGDRPRRPRRRTDLHARRARARSLAHGRPDRKSTRLNSSHLGISYAVFCLKKKNIKPAQIGM